MCELRSAHEVFSGQPGTRFHHLAAFFIFLSWLFIFAPSNDCNAEESLAPFKPGEKLTFALKWGFIEAGEAVLEVLPIETVNEVEAYHFVMTVKSSPLVDLVYEVRNKIESYSDIDMTHSMLYLKKEKEGKRSGDVVVNFDWDKKEAQYSNFGKKKKPISIVPGSFDPFSAFYRLRFLDFGENQKISLPITDGKRCVTGEAKIIKKEKIKIGGHAYDTFLMEPELKDVRGVFRKSKNATLQIWVTADERKIPVLLKSKVIVGSFRGELVSIENAAQK